MSWNHPVEQSRRAANARAAEQSEAERMARAAAEAENRVAAAAATWPTHTDQPARDPRPAEQEITMPTPTPSDAVAQSLARMRNTVANPIATTENTSSSTGPATPVADAAEQALARMTNTLGITTTRQSTTTRKDS